MLALNSFVLDFSWLMHAAAVRLTNGLRKQKYRCGVITRPWNSPLKAATEQPELDSIGSTHSTNYSYRVCKYGDGSRSKYLVVVWWEVSSLANFCEFTCKNTMEEVKKGLRQQFIRSADLTHLDRDNEKKATRCVDSPGMLWLAHRLCLCSSRSADISNTAYHLISEVTKQSFLYFPIKATEEPM